MMIKSMLTLMLITLTMNKINKFKKNNNTMNTIECGFNSNMNSKMSFSTNFFTVMMMFILFDLETIIVVPLMNINNYKMNSSLTIMFTMFIGMTMMMEIKNKKIKWTN